MKTNLLALLGLVLILGGAAHAQQQERVTVDPINDLTVKMGQSTPVQFAVHIRSGFHVNSHDPLSPELIRTELRFSPPEDLVIAKVQYPAGENMSFPFDPTSKLSVYSGDVTIRATILTQPKATAGHYTVHAELKYQACDNNACYPPKKLPVTFNVKISSGASGRRVRATRTSPHVH